MTKKADDVQGQEIDKKIRESVDMLLRSQIRGDVCESDYHYIQRIKNICKAHYRTEAIDELVGEIEKTCIFAFTDESTNTLIKDIAHIDDIRAAAQRLKEKT